jgi:hypothetical protein
MGFNSFRLLKLQQQTTDNLKQDKQLGVFMKNEHHKSMLNANTSLDLTIFLLV